MNADKRFAELAGIEYHAPIGNALEYIPCKFRGYTLFQAGELTKCTCGYVDYTDCMDDHFSDTNPDFTDAREVLKVMKEREDWFDFAVYLRARGKATIISCATTSGVDRLHIDITLMIDETGLLRDEAIRFLEGR